MKFFLIIAVFLIPTICHSQTSYDKEVIGVWKGDIYGGGLPKKSITIVVTKSNYYNSQRGVGTCQGYSLVNNSNKTPFSGTIIVEADMPIIEVYEPKSNAKNGKFYLSLLCFDENHEMIDLGCGTWISYDGKINRKIRVKKLR